MSCCCCRSNTKISAYAHILLTEHACQFAAHMHTRITTLTLLLKVMNALVMYVGVQAIATVKSAGKGGSAPSFVRSPAMEIYSWLAAELDTEGM